MNDLTNRGGLRPQRAIGMSAENIFQMYTRLGSVDFFVKRNSWSHPRAAARIVSPLCQCDLRHLEPSI
jgi:hypothetical protein